MNASNADATLAVVAHELLGSLSVCSGAMRTVLDHPDLSSDQRTQLVTMAQRQVEQIAGTLVDLMRGVCPDVLGDRSQLVAVAG